MTSKLITSTILLVILLDNMVSCHNLGVDYFEFCHKVDCTQCIRLLLGKCYKFPNSKLIGNNINSLKIIWNDSPKLFGYTDPNCVSPVPFSYINSPTGLIDLNLNFNDIKCVKVNEVTL